MDKYPRIIYLLKSLKGSIYTSCLADFIDVYSRVHPTMSFVFVIPEKKVDVIDHPVRLTDPAALDMWMGCWWDQVHSFSSNWRELKTLVLTLCRQYVRSDSRTKDTTLLYFMDNLITYTLLMVEVQGVLPFKHLFTKLRPWNKTWAVFLRLSTSQELPLLPKALMISAVAFGFRPIALISLLLTLFPSCLPKLNYKAIDFCSFDLRFWISHLRLLSSILRTVTLTMGPFLADVLFGLLLWKWPLP